MPRAVARRNGIVVAAADDASARVDKDAAHRHLVSRKGRRRLLQRQLHVGVVERVVHGLPNRRWLRRARLRQAQGVSDSAGSAMKVVHTAFIHRRFFRVDAPAGSATHTMWAIKPGSSLEHQADSNEEDHRHDWKYALDAGVGSTDGSDRDDEPPENVAEPPRRQSIGPTPGRPRGFLRGTPGKTRREPIRFCCYLCGEDDHGANDCPADICIGCLGSGHQSNECPAGRRPTVCTHCGRLGHIRRECTVAQERGDLALIRCLRCVCEGLLMPSAPGRHELISGNQVSIQVSRVHMAWQSFESVWTHTMYTYFRLPVVGTSSAASSSPSYRRPHASRAQQ